MVHVSPQQTFGEEQAIRLSLQLSAAALHHFRCPFCQSGEEHIHLFAYFDGRTKE